MNLLRQLQLLQEKHGYLPREELAALAKERGLSLAEVIGIASFYEFFTFAPGQEREYIEKLYPCRRADILLTPPKRGFWAALGKARTAPGGVIPDLKEAGLLGRGGGGFPVWTKWQTVRDEEADEKYVICNADEGEPGTGKDRVLIERNPNAIIEGMAICAAAVGAKKAAVYLRGEYADLKERLERAVREAPLGELEMEICMGSGAYVCGEETALIASLEGRRGEPRLKPPYPGVAGLYGKPTIVNNAETFACVPFILEFGPESFRKRGTDDCPGTKLYTVCGKVKKPGVYELNGGATVAQLLEAAGGGSETLRAVLIGGGSGSILGLDCLDMPVSPRACAERGASFGTASLRFIGESEDLLSLVIDLCAFYGKESCGMCVPCRVGLQRLKGLLEKVRQGRAFPEELSEINGLSEHIRANARCGLGQAAVTPVLSLMKNFPEVLK